MQDSLRAKGYLPITTSYGGTETVDVGIFDTLGNNAIVDWIKIELRDKSNSATILYTRSALLQRDGDIVETDGISPVFFNDVAFDDYFISIKHRNHLGIMSASAVTFSSTIETVNFSNITTFGTDAQKNLVAGISGMWAADVDDSESIDAADRSSVWSVRNFLNYQSDDANLNGTCNADDRILTWNNRNRVAQLP